MANVPFRGQHRAAVLLMHSAFDLSNVAPLSLFTVILTASSRGMYCHFDYTVWPYFERLQINSSDTPACRTGACKTTSVSCMDREN